MSGVTPGPAHYGEAAPSDVRAIRDVTLLYFDDCPSWQTADARLRSLSAQLEVTITRVRVDTPEAAARWEFRGSPSFLVDGEDPFAAPDQPVGLACRIYDTPEGPAGCPTEAQLRDALS